MTKRFWIAAVALAASAGMAQAESSLLAPIVEQSGVVLSGGFGPRSSAAGEAFHAGADIAAEVGAEVHAPADGSVLQVHAPGARPHYSGQVVEIDHGDLGKTRFSGLQAVVLEPGAMVRAGDIIGRVADTERPHVHVELWRDGRVLDPAHELVLFPAR